jgi:hypothetical protein
MADTKISALPSGAPAQAGDEYVVARSSANYKLTLTNIAASMPETTITSTNTIKLKLTGGTAQNALAFEPVSGTNQYSIHAGNSLLVGGDKGFMIYDNTNGRAKLFCDDGTGETRILGTTFSTVYANGSERMRIDGSTGNVGVGTATPDAKLTVNGAASFSDGTASAPGIANSGDLDTGVYFPAANEVAVTTGGSVAAAFNSNGVFFRNRIINGDMRIAQRGTAAVTASGDFPVDRLTTFVTTTGAFSAQQDSDAPAGFVNSTKFTVTTAGTVSSTQAFLVTQRVEGTNIADLAWGTASARTVTLSFWVRSSLTGTFGGAVSNSAVARSYPFSYTISSANTWEYKTITIPGDTTGTWLTTTGVGIRVIWGLGVGSTLSNTAGAWAAGNFNSVTGAVDWITNLNATWYVTGVQLESGSVATPFERRPFGTELMLCQRYYQTVRACAQDNGAAASTKAYTIPVNFNVAMRAAPTITYTAITTSNVTSRTAINIFEYGFAHQVIASGGPSMLEISTAVASIEL